MDGLLLHSQDEGRVGWNQIKEATGGFGSLLATCLALFTRLSTAKGHNTKADACSVGEAHTVRHRHNHCAIDVSSYAKVNRLAPNGDRPMYRVIFRLLVLHCVDGVMEDKKKIQTCETCAE
jgi:hypothetical protein